MSIFSDAGLQCPQDDCLSRCHRVEGGKSDTRKHTSLLGLHSGNYEYMGQQKVM